MRYQRVLLIAELGRDHRAAIAEIRRVAPQAERLVVVARAAERKLAWLFRNSHSGVDPAASAGLEELRAVATEAAPEVEIVVSDKLDIDALDELVRGAGIDLLVTRDVPLSSLPTLIELRTRRSIAMLWVPKTLAPRDPDPTAEVICVAIGARARAAFASFLHDRADPSQPMSLLLPAGEMATELAAAKDVAGVKADVKVMSPEDEGVYEWIDRRIRSTTVGLLVFARFPITLLLRERWPVPILLLPPTYSPPLLQRAIEAADVVDDGRPVRVRVEFVVGIGRRTPIPDQQLAVVAGGQIVAVVQTHHGEAELPADCRADSYGFFRMDAPDVTDPVAAVELVLAMVRVGSRPLLLFDAELDELGLSRLHALTDRYDVLAVRLRPIRALRTIRERLRAAKLSPSVVDCSAVLDEGDAIDVPDAVDAIRLSRVATWLRGHGFPVVAIVHRGATHPATLGFAALHVAQLDAGDWASQPPGPSPATLASRLDTTTGSAQLPGNRIELELDNATARGWLLAAIDSSTERVHVQVYMAADDDVGRRIEAALDRAAARGVQVRLLVDSLHGMHGSLGAKNPLLDRLGARSGIELRLSQPIIGVPSLVDLKQRDHRKLVVVDNQLALLGGRNFSHEYYTDFDEVALTAQSMWRDVPWLDAGARVEGTAVAVLESMFLAAWTQAGGDPFAVVDTPAAGTTCARIVIHRGLQDAHTLEAYLALIESAQSHVYVVNGFPLILEIQHALLRALRRGVRVRTLFGHLTPTHGGVPFSGPWSSARTAATDLVHSRMDTLITAGAEGYEIAVAEQPTWEKGLGSIRTHVHAKLMSVDGRACAVGSANMDITAAYWESELLLVVEDAAVAGPFERRIDALMASSQQVDRDDPVWQKLARGRQWMRNWPGVLSV
jgi:phosphatidylserine/phosphatidylglycerophosphate/cardiolipin synthase-like enzyme